MIESRLDMLIWNKSSSMLGWTYFQIRSENYVTCTCNHSFQPSWTACSSSGLLYSWGYLFVGRKNASPRLIPAWNPGDCIIIRIQHNLPDAKAFYLGSSPFPVISSLNFVQKVVPFLMGNGALVLILIFCIIMHVCRETILSSDADLVLHELIVM